MYNLTLVNDEEINDIIMNPKSNKGLFFSIFDDYTVVIDNSTCECWTETFNRCEDAILWLIDKEREID